VGSTTLQLETTPGEFERTPISDDEVLIGPSSCGTEGFNVRSAYHYLGIHWLKLILSVSVQATVGWDAVTGLGT
jgi:hypothetical protein